MFCNFYLTRSFSVNCDTLWEDLTGFVSVKVNYTNNSFNNDTVKYLEESGRQKSGSSLFGQEVKEANLK